MAAILKEYLVKNVGMEGENLRMLERNEAAETCKEASSCKS